MLNNTKNIKNPDPFTEVLATFGNHELYEDLRRISRVQQETEYEMVRRGYRDANILHISPDHFDKQIEKVFRDGLIWLPMRRTKRYSGFSHKHFPVEKLDMNSMVYGVVAQDMDIAQEFANAELGKNVNHIKIGELLGYPECCSKAFTIYWKYSMDPVFESSVGGIKVPEVGNEVSLNNWNWKLRTDLRYFGLRVVPWFPCSVNCEHSAKLANDWLYVMRDIDSDVATKCKELMQTGSEWNLLNGIVQVTHPEFIGLAGSYYNSEQRIVRFI